MNSKDIPESAALSEKQLLRLLLDHIPDRIYFKDLDSRFILVNRACAETFGLRDAAGAVGKTDFDFFTNEHAQQAFDDEQRVIATGEPLIGTVEKETWPEHTGWGFTTKMPLRDEAGQVRGTFGITRDFTDLKTAQDELARANEALRQSYEELKETQGQLIEAEKMSSVGRLVAGLAHEIKNPLALIRMSGELLASVLGSQKDESLAVALKTMQEGVGRADALVCELQRFATESGPALAAASLNAVVAQALNRVRHHIALGGVTLVKHLGPALPGAMLDREKIVQVLIHVITNALHAMSDGGTLTVTTRTRTLGAGDIADASGDRTGRRQHAEERVAVVEIEDTGAGIPAEVLEKVFDPFFTTKPTGEGVGLGLTVSRKLVELHGGALRVENRPGGGVRATLELPLAAQP
jgi:PAS domain S-box-containing protein